MIRDDIKTALIQSMKSRNEARTSAIRLIQAAIHNRDIEMRTGSVSTDDDAMIIDVLQKMGKQRRESIEMFDKGGRTELADAERSELEVIQSFLPAQMDEAEAENAIRALVAELGATSVKDMGRVMAAMKERFGGKLDMARASSLVKSALN